MPRSADHELTGTRLTSGAIQVLDEQGLAALSWQSVAKASEMSVGEVRHRCELRRARLVHLVVMTLCRSRKDRLVRAGVLPFMRPEPIDLLLALLPDTETDRCDTRVLVQLASASGLPEESARLLRSQEAADRRRCESLAGGDPVNAALLHVVTAGLDRAMADRDEPLGREVAEQVLRGVVAGTLGAVAD